MDEQQQDHQPAQDADPYAVRPTPYACLEDRHRWWIVSLHQGAPKGLDGMDVPIGADVLCLRCRYLARDLSGPGLLALLQEDGAANLAQWASMMRAVAL